MGLLKRVIDKWFDETDWPHDPFLNPLRDSVWTLTLNGEQLGWLFTSVTPMRSFPFFGKQESLWATPFVRGTWPFLSEEDYGPDWPVAKDILAGHYDHFDNDRGDTRYTVQQVPADKAQPLWELFRSEFQKRDSPET